MESNNAVVVEDVHLVVAGPRTFEPGRLKCWDTGGQRWPQHGIECVIVRLERSIVRVGARRNSGNVSGAFGADPETGRIDQQGERLHPGWTRDDIDGTPARCHWQIESRQTGDRTRPGTCRVDDKTTRHLAARGKAN